MTRRNTFVTLLPAGIVLLACAFMTSCKKETCTVEPAAVAIMTPDKGAAIDLYTKKCHDRGTKDPTKNKEYQVVVLRPVAEPPPEDNRYKEEDVVFEVEKGPERMQLSFGNPGTLVYFNYLPEEERKSGLAIECYLSCPEAGLRKQLLSWHGKPIHYFRTEAPNTPPIVQ